MDIEKLTKSQIVLLTLMVSFMTSIATGIVTVSLMQQAPPAITETVNRVVEHTVEKVVQGQVASVALPQQQPAKTLVVKESDMIPAAVHAAAQSLVRVYSSDADTPTFLGLGIVLDDTGTIIVDQGLLAEAADANIELADGTRVRGFVRSRDDATGVAYLAASTSSSKGTIIWKPAQFAPQRPPLGQSVILVSGKASNRVAQGLVTALSADDGSVPQIETDIGKDVIMPGSPIIDTDGTVVGVSTKASRSSNASGFIAGASLLPHTEVKESPATTK
jgi:S1-C subfamily serine protease